MPNLRTYAEVCDTLGCTSNTADPPNCAGALICVSASEETKRFDDGQIAQRYKDATTMEKIGKTTLRKY